ncbi:hypothetical protein RM572_00310 [Streptomyces sp. DSM 42041]|uniref:Uncharacterized protein n=1 Tax=Streptomyces hazeniae TaxID=3075538 RepID=A0ABU2NJW9_9ACTN|nr:hypothetical protein [Streptomyces sp. DSM 42041]MDT0377218.1 hypothetical protein [Streptomyces sp. DSM 42041]
MSAPETTDEGGAWISSGQIYRELQRHNELLVKLTTQLERGRYEERISALESRMWWLSGAATVAGAVLGRMLPV